MSTACAAATGPSWPASARCSPTTRSSTAAWKAGGTPSASSATAALRIPLDAQLCRTAKTQPTIVACARENAQKRAALEKLGVTVLHLPGADGRVDLRALMAVLGGQEIDSGPHRGRRRRPLGGARKRHRPAAARLCGRKGIRRRGGPPAPWADAGVAAVADAFSLGAPQVEVFGKDVLLTYDLEKER